MSVATETRLDAAIEAATTRLLELQHPDGYWVGELESNATMIAQHLFWHHVLGLRTPELDRKIANELLARQRDDGTWAIWFDGPGDLSTTVEAYAALKLAGVDPGPQARDFIRSRRRDREDADLHEVLPRPARPVAVAAGDADPGRARALPAERAVLDLQLLLLGAQARSSRSRPARRCGRCGPPTIDLREIGARPGKTRSPAPPGPMRRAALREAERWVRAHQEADGSWGGIQPPWVWSILMLAALGHGFEDETLRRAVEGWEGFTIDEGDRLRPEACQSPVWDTGLAVLALRDAGLGPEHPALVRAADWLLHEEVTVTGDWAVRTPELAPGGWAFEFENDLYPDVDDTAVVALALRRCHRGHDAVDRGLAWTAGMQSRSGGWGAFDVDNEALLALQAPVLRLRQGHRRAERRRHARTRSRRSRPRPATTTRCAAGSTGCCASRRPTAPGSAAGASTTSTAPAPRCPRSRRAESSPATARSGVQWRGSTRCRTRTAASARTSAPTPIAPGAAAGPARLPKRPGRY